MIVIFDLDYTLLDTNKLKDGLVNVFGLTKRQYSLDYDRIYTKKKTHYSPYKHLKLLAREGRILSLTKTKKKLENLIKGLNKYLFVYSEDVLKKFKKRGDVLVLMSIGDKAWQKKKIDNLKIKKYFDKIIILDKKKYQNLGFLKKSNPPVGSDILIINDNAKETLKMKKAIGKCVVCLVRGPYSRNVKHNFKIYNIKDCLKLYE